MNWAEMIHDPKFSLFSALATMFSGIDLRWLQMLPSYVSLAAAILGCLLTVVLIRNHLLTRKKLKLELRLLQAKCRKEEGCDLPEN